MASDSFIEAWLWSNQGWLMNNDIAVEDIYATSEKKKKKVECSYYLPDDLFIELILCRLPLHCLFRCTAVCKAWRKLVHDAHGLYGGTRMTNYALGLLSYRPPRLTVIIPHGCDDKNNYEGRAARTIFFRHCIPPDWTYCDVSNGFLLHLCESGLMRRVRGGCTVRLYVTNPLTSRSIPLPLIHSFPTQPFCRFSMLAFDPARSHHYKVLSFFGEPITMKGDKLFEKVFVFSSEQSNLGWRRLEVELRAPPDKVCLSTARWARTICAKGNAYRLCFRSGPGPECDELYDGAVLIFNVKEESFEVINSPPHMYHDETRVLHELGKAKDCLQFIYYDADNISIWRLEEDGRHWALQHQLNLNVSLGYSCVRAMNLFGSCALAFHGNEEVLYFMRESFLHCWYIKQNKIELYKNSDGTRVEGEPRSLIPFPCCAIDPEFRPSGKY